VRRLNLSLQFRDVNSVPSWAAVFLCNPQVSCLLPGWADANSSSSVRCFSPSADQLNQLAIWALTPWYNRVGNAIVDLEDLGPLIKSLSLMGAYCDELMKT